MVKEKQFVVSEKQKEFDLNFIEEAVGSPDKLEQFIKSKLQGEDAYYELFDADNNKVTLFSARNLQELFEEYDFKVEMNETGKNGLGLPVGKLVLLSEDISFELSWETFSHDNVIDDFVDLKTVNVI